MPSCRLIRNWGLAMPNQPRLNWRPSPSSESHKRLSTNLKNSSYSSSGMFSGSCSVWALTVAPLYCLVAARWGRGAATEPELASWAEVKPRGPEGKVGCKVNPETREASTSREEEEEMEREMVGGMLV